VVDLVLCQFPAVTCSTVAVGSRENCCLVFREEGQISIGKNGFSYHVYVEGKKKSRELFLPRLFVLVAVMTQDRITTVG
jgi:hypothetical protein